MKSVVLPHPITLDARRAEAARAAHYEEPLRQLVRFFEDKGLERLKQEDRDESWYDDWVAYQTKHGIYGSLLSPAALSTRGTRFDLFRLTRFMEAFAYFSPAHGYNLQVSFLGIFPLLMSTNSALKRRAVEALEKGGLFAFGVSEKTHGSDLYSSEMKVETTSAGSYRANGSKYYIGNSAHAAMISVLGRSVEGGKDPKEGFVFFACEPDGQTLKDSRKIRTMGVKQAHVGAFTLEDYRFDESSVIAKGRKAWDAIFGTVNMGKFFLGFGSIGICEHAFDEAIAHARGRVLFGRAVTDMPHIRSTLSRAYARLAGMKLYAYRAVDYLQEANANDRRYLLYNSVQKARVSVEGTRVVSLLSEVVGAKGFESDTYFEMAMRDVQLIPGLEGSTHINFGLTAQFARAYFFRGGAVTVPSSALLDENARNRENPYLFEASSGAFRDVRFGKPLASLTELRGVANAEIFSGQANALKWLLLALNAKPVLLKEADLMLAVGRAFAIVAYGQLVAENARLLDIEPGLTNLVFHELIEDLSNEGLKIASLPAMPRILRPLARRMVTTAATTAADFEATWSQVEASFLHTAR